MNNTAEAASQVRQLRYSVFASVTDLKTTDARSCTWSEFVEVIQSPTVYRSKDTCPLLKLATFGDQANGNGSLRYDGNVARVFGIEGDYDDNVITAAEGAARLRAAGVRAVIYTSATHGVVCKKNPRGGPRWRVLAPLSAPVDPSLRGELVSLLNGALGGILAGESWTLSQTYYFGAVEGVAYEAHVIDGDPLDVVAYAPSFDPIASTKKVKKAVELDKPRRKQDADNAEVAHLLASGLVTRMREDGAVDCLCPRGWMHGTDSGASSTTYFPAGLGGREVGGFQCTHNSCGQPTTSEFWQWSGLQALQPKPIDAFDVVAPATDSDGNEIQPLPSFARDRQGKIKSERGNLFTALTTTNLSGLQIRQDTFRDEIMVAPSGTESWRPIADTDYTDMCTRMESGSNGFTHIPTDRIREMVASVALDNRFDSARFWLDSLVWDGVSRVERFLVDHLRADDTPYTRAVSRYLLTALAGRVLQPGIKADMVPVFVGPQGAGKSTVVAALAPQEDAFLELDLGKSDADQAREMRGVLVVELGEMKGLRKKEEAALKAFISRRVDVWVEKWKTHASRYARRSVFIGTTNSQEFLIDDTGHRRWLPVDVPGQGSPQEVSEAGAAVARDRDQLWAEAVQIFNANGIEWQAAERLARPEHARFEVVEPWTSAIETWLSSNVMDGPDGDLRGDEPFTTEAVLLGAIHIELRNISDFHRKRVATVLRKLNYVDRREQVGGKRTTRWHRTEIFA